MAALQQSQTSSVESNECPISLPKVNYKVAGENAVTMDETESYMQKGHNLKSYPYRSCILSSDTAVDDFLTSTFLRITPDEVTSKFKTEKGRDLLNNIVAKADVLGDMPDFLHCNPKACGISGSEKPKERLKVVAACYRESVANKLEKQESSVLEKKRKSGKNDRNFGPHEKKTKIIKVAAAVSGASKLNPNPNPNPKSSGLVKRGENAKKVGEEKNSSSKTTSTPAHGIHSCSSSNMNLSSSGENKSKPFSKSTFKPLDFYNGPWKPSTENNSFGWLTE